MYHITQQRTRSRHSVNLHRVSRILLLFTLDTSHLVMSPTKQVATLDTSHFETSLHHCVVASTLDTSHAETSLLSAVRLCSRPTSRCCHLVWWRRTVTTESPVFRRSRYSAGKRSWCTGVIPRTTGELCSSDLLLSIRTTAGMQLPPIHRSNHLSAVVTQLLSHRRICRNCLVITDCDHHQLSTPTTLTVDLIVTTTTNSQSHDSDHDHLLNSTPSVLLSAFARRGFGG